MEKAVKNK